MTALDPRLDPKFSCEWQRCGKPAKFLVEALHVCRRHASATCRFAENGHERGYAPPCSTCQRPLMSNWQAKPKGKQP